MIDLVATEAPGTKDPNKGAGKTLQQNILHFFRVLADLPIICSDELNHVRPTNPDRANRRFPTEVARAANVRVSCNARLATVADKTLINGQT
jgi:hypothetical protein